MARFLPPVSRRALLERARTDWRRLAAWSLMAVAVSLALFLGFKGERTTRRIERTIVQQGTPCVQLRDGRPSAGCERLARLLARTCVARPELCDGVLRRALQESSPEARRRLAATVQRELRRDRERRRRGSDGGGGGGGGGSPSPPARRPPATSTAPSPNVTPQTTASTPAVPDPTTTATPRPPVPTPTTPEPGRPRPSVSDGVNGAADHAAGAVNDVTDAVGAGRPVPDPPNLPATVTVPDLLPDLPCLRLLGDCPPSR